MHHVIRRDDHRRVRLIDRIRDGRVADVVVVGTTCKAPTVGVVDAGVRV